MGDLAWRFLAWMCKPSKLKERAWRFFFWITPRWLSKKFQIYMLRCYVERYPGEMERKIRESLPKLERKLRAELAPFLKLQAERSGATLSEEELAAMSKPPSEEELAAWSKQCLNLMLHPEDRDAILKSARTPDAR